jgi:hypothetical protein
VEALAALTWVEALSLSGTVLSAAGVARVRAALPGCRIYADPIPA